MPKPRAEFRPVRPPEPLDRSGLQDPLNHTRLVRYRRAVMEAHGSIGFAGLPTRVEESGRDVPLAALFVVPRLSSAPTPPEAFDRDPPPATADAYAALRGNPRLVVLGDPGAGKTTLVSWIASSLCAPGGGGELASHLGAPYIPFVFTLRALAIPAKPKWADLLKAFLEQPQSAALAESRELVDHLLTIGQAFIILDGLDELGNAAKREEVREAVWDGMNLHNRCRWLLTSRVVGYEEVRFHLAKNPDAPGADRPAIPTEHFSRTETDEFYLNRFALRLYLAPFADDQIREFANNWWRQNVASPVIAASDPARFVEALRASAGTRTLARIPNILALVCFLYRTDAELPDGRWIIYHRIAEAYLRTIQRAKKQTLPLPHEWTTHHRWLAAIAWRMQLARLHEKGESEGAGGLMFRQRRILKVLRPLIMAADGCDESKADETGRAFLDFVADRSGLLIPREHEASGDHNYAFSHLSFQEYFAAAYLCEAVTDPDWQERDAENESAGTTLAHVRKYAAEPLWREVLIFLFEGVSEVNPRHPASLLTRLLGWRRRCEEWPDRLDLKTLSMPDKKRKENEKNIAELLAMLVVNPQATFDGTVGWEGPVRASLWRRCWRWELERQQNSPRGGLLPQTTILSPLLFARSGAVQRSVQRLLEAGRQLPALHALDLRECRALTDIAWLTEFPTLAFLRLNDCDQIRDFSPLAGLKNLERLYANRCVVGERPDWLSGLRELTRLDLNDCPVLTDLTPLRGLTALVILELINNGQLTDLAPLRELSQLQYLYLNGCHAITDLSALGELTNLSELWMRNLPTALESQIIELSRQLPRCLVYSDYGTLEGGKIAGK